MLIFQIGMRATHKTSSSTCNALLSSVLLGSNRTTLQTSVSASLRVSELFVRTSKLPPLV